MVKHKNDLDYKEEVIKKLKECIKRIKESPKEYIPIVIMIQGTRRPSFTDGFELNSYWGSDYQEDMIKMDIHYQPIKKQEISKKRLDDEVD